MPRGVVADSALCPLAAAPDPPFARGRFADSVQRAAEELADSNVRRLKQLRTRLDAGLEGGLRRGTWENSPLYGNAIYSALPAYQYCTMVGLISDRISRTLTVGLESPVAL